MKKIQLQKQKVRRRRSLRVRKNLRGTAEKPRLCVIKSNLHLKAQLIDDEKGHTLAASSTNDKEMSASGFSRKSKQAARALGEKIAKAAQEKNVKEIVFDRGRFKYHGILSEFADVIREFGLQF